MRTMCNIESSPKLHGSTHYGPLRQCMKEAQGNLERMHMAGNAQHAFVITIHREAQLVANAYLYRATPSCKLETLL